jgi:hypothetical protein
MLIEHILDTIPFLDKKYFHKVLSKEIFQFINNNLYNRINGNILRIAWVIFDDKLVIKQYPIRIKGKLKEGEQRCQLRYQKEFIDPFLDFYYEAAWEQLC